MHSIPEQKLHLIHEMDRKIGEFMQKRADVVNRIIEEMAVFEAGDEVEVYNGQDLVGIGTIVQPLFLKRQGIITYRVKMEDGNVFTNEIYHLQRVNIA